jgi:unsaturated chondroitin disaccharide hydrolase
MLFEMILIHFMSKHHTLPKCLSSIYAAMALMLSVSFSYGQLSTKETDKALAAAERQVRNQLKELPYRFVYPRSVHQDGTIKVVESRDWTSGFFPGLVWMMYEHTKDEYFLKEARRWCIGLEKEKENTSTHDLGFMINCSFGKGYRLTRELYYDKTIIGAAKSLSTRFNPRIGCIKSWDHGGWLFPVIIDNMMNLELLFEATRLTGDSSFYNIAVTHANTTLKNHFRGDYSSYHVVDYDSVTGKVIRKVTHQGYSDESAWARGQAWGLYGFTTVYRYTKDKRFLDQAEHIARFMLTHDNLPADKIPFWDYNAGAIPNEPRDVSAAAICASALIELADYSSSRVSLLKSASDILRTLSSEKYLAKSGTNNNFVLMHGVGHKPGNYEIDVPLIYADYYFVEALLRYRKISKG